MKRRFSHGSRTKGKAIILGVAASLISVLLFSFIFAVISYSTENPSSSVGIFAILTLVLSGALMGAFVSRYKGDGGIGCAVISALAVALVIIIVRTIVGGSVSIPLFINCACYIAATALCSFLSRPKGKRRHR